VTAACSAAFDVTDPERDDPPGVQGKDPVDRPYETDFQIGPAHRLAEGDVGDESRHDRGEEPFGRLAGDLFPGAEILPLLRCCRFQRVHIDTLSPGEPQGGRGGIPVFIEGGFSCGSEFFDHLVILPFGDVVDRQEETAGRPHSPDLPAADPVCRQFPPDDLLHITERLRQKGGRNLLGADFEQQFVAHHFPLLAAISVCGTGPPLSPGAVWFSRG
jgi:hypothetical protein